MNMHVCIKPATSVFVHSERRLILPLSASTNCRSSSRSNFVRSLLSVLANWSCHCALFIGTVSLLYFPIIYRQYYLTEDVLVFILSLSPLPWCSLGLSYMDCIAVGATVSSSLHYGQLWISVMVSI